MASVSRIGEGVGSMEHFAVRILGVACRSSADVRIPCTHGPPGRVVRIQRDRVCLLFDQLQVCNKIFRCFRKLCNTGLLEYCLVIEHTLCSSCGRNAIYSPVILLGARETDLPFHCLQIAVGHEIVPEFLSVNCRDHHDIAPFTALQTKQRILGIIRNSLDVDLDIRIHLMKFINVRLIVRSGIIRRQHICPVRKQL